MWGIYFKKDIHTSSGASSVKQLLLGDESLDVLGWDKSHLEVLPTVDDKDLSKFFVVLLSSADGFREVHWLTRLLQGWGAQRTKLGFRATIPCTLCFIDLTDEQHCSVYRHNVCLFLLEQQLISGKKVTHWHATQLGVFISHSAQDHIPQ